MGEPGKVPAVRKLETFNLPDETYPDWSPVKGQVPDIDFSITGKPKVSWATFYGKIDGPGLRDHTCCKPTATGEWHLFNPFKLYIATRNLYPKGSFVKITLLDEKGQPILDSDGKEIFVIAENVDYGPNERYSEENYKQNGYKKTRDVDLSYGIAKYFSEKAGEKLRFIAPDGTILKSSVRVKSELTDIRRERKVEEQDERAQIIRAFSFYHKITGVDPKKIRKRTHCLSMETVANETWVKPSTRDQFQMTWVGGKSEEDVANNYYVSGLCLYTVGADGAQKQVEWLRKQCMGKIGSKLGISESAFINKESGNIYSGSIGPFDSEEKAWKLFHAIDEGIMPVFGGLTIVEK